MSETPAAPQPPSGDPMTQQSAQPQQPPAVQPAQPQQPPAVQPAKSGGAGKKILGIVAAVVIIAIVAAVKIGGGKIWSLVTGDISTAKAGDCVNDFSAADDAKVVECGTPEAKYKVDGIVENVSDADFTTKQQELCEAFPNWETVVWTGRRGGNGDAWCLTPVN